MKFKYLFGTLVLVLLILYFTFGVELDTITTEQAGYATLIVLLGALPSAVAMVDRREANLLPLMPLHGLFYALTFGLPVFSSKTMWFDQSDEALNSALVLTIVGLVCLYVGYYACRRLFSNLQPVHFLGNISYRLQSRVGWFLYGAYLLFQIFPALSALPSVGQLSAPLGYLSLGILFMLALDNHLPKIQWYLLVVAITFTLFTKLLSGFLAGPVFFLLFFAIIYWRKRQRLPWFFVLLTIVITILLNPVKKTYRENTWGDQYVSQTYYEKALIFYQSAMDYYGGESVLNTVATDDSTINRLAHIAAFAYVIDLTPKSVPYWLGGSYETLWSSFIPRVFWPGKPTATIGQEFGHRYSLLSEENDTTSFNFPWLPEFYANFGAVGVVVGMFIVGALFRFLVQKFNSPMSRRIENTLGISITFNLFYAESNFALMAGGVLLTYLAFVVLLRLLTGSSAARAKIV